MSPLDRSPMQDIRLYSITSDQDVTDIYDYAEPMLRANSYLKPPVSLAGRHSQRYVIDTTNDSGCEVAA